MVLWSRKLRNLWQRRTTILLADRDRRILAPRSRWAESEKGRRARRDLLTVAVREEQARATLNSFVQRVVTWNHALLARSTRPMLNS